MVNTSEATFPKPPFTKTESDQSKPLRKTKPKKEEKERTVEPTARWQW